MGVSAIRTILYAVGVLLSLITLAVSAAACAMKIGVYTGDWYYGYGLAVGYGVWWRGILAFSILSFLYFTIASVLGFMKKGKPFNYVVTDISILSTLFIIGLATTGWGTAGLGTSWAVGAAAIAFGWLLTFLCLGIVVFVVVYALVRHGGARSTFMSTLEDLEALPGKPRGGVEAGGAAPGVVQPMYVAQPGVQPVMQQPIMQQPAQQGYVIQPALTGNSAPMSTDLTGNSFIPQQQPPAQTYTVNLAQPGMNQSQTTYTVGEVAPVKA